MKVLMHICCATCCLYPIKSLKSRGVDVTGFWFNPNIHPYTEYRQRLDSLRHLESLWELEISYSDCYGLKDFLEAVVNTEASRCEHCYSTRLEETAGKAREYGMEAFTTSLLVSPYQKIDRIQALGRTMAEKYDIEFLDRDYREGFGEGRNMSRDLGLYRQKYCGCIYSEMDRYLGVTE